MQGVPEGARRAIGWLAMAIVTLSMAAPTTTEYVKLPAGRLASVLAGDADKEPLAIAAFAMRATPVTQREFGRFVQAHPQWRRDRAPATFADPGYLSSWRSAESPGAASAEAQPV